MSDPRIFDVIVVGGRCAGSTAALALARAGRRVALVEKDERFGEVISTHFCFPNTVARLEELGVLDRIRKRHRLTLVTQAYSFYGHDVPGNWTSIEGNDRGLSLRRSVLDANLFAAALDAGADARLGARVTGLVGAGTTEDPVRGVVLASGDELHAPLVVGADGRSSFVARTLGVREHDERAGSISFMWVYTRGLASTKPRLHFAVDEGRTMLRYPCEDDVDLVLVGGDASFTSGTKQERRQRFREQLSRFPDKVPPDALEHADEVSEIVVAPETLMRGFFRQAQGPGWALIGDAGHFKHPSTAQGICDAVEQGLELAARFDRSGAALDGFEAWRDERSREHYDFSLSFGVLPPREAGEPLFRGLTSDAEASRDFLESLERLTPPSRVFSPERLGRWFAA